ncbi:MAG: hypothetical protein KJ915_06460 [Candidatus Omnitrophica bacterium]|nr:hypothetical protein [Candidatus Omnitrophota bacterium]
MKKIKVTICTGTACYVLGNSQLLVMKDDLKPELLKWIDFEGSNCLKYCKDASFGKAPFVLINGKLMAQATGPKVKDEIERLYLDMLDGGE